MYSCPDSLDYELYAYLAQQARQEAEAEANAPRCCCCNAVIFDEYYFDIDGDIYCESCMNHEFRVMN